MRTRQRHQALKTDLYELTMAAGYVQNHMSSQAVFELYWRVMPPNRSFLIACGLEQALSYISSLTFSNDDILFLKSLDVFKHTKEDFWDFLKNFSFGGDVYAMREGEVFFADEPILQVVAPIAEAQLLETYLLSVFNIECLVASKAARIVHAAREDGLGRSVVDFGSRRAHGPDAAVLAARAAYVAGCAGTSNVLAGQAFDIPLYGTIAHSWISAYDDEQEAFKRYHDCFPDHTILLVDTYDTLKAVKAMTGLDYRDQIKAIRLDSGDLFNLSSESRRILDAAGLSRVKIIASGGLNEYKIKELVQAGAPIDSFGVGTDMVTSSDYSAADLIYKLVQIETDGQVKYKAKRSPRKQTVPGHKQIYRGTGSDHRFSGDKVCLKKEEAPSRTRPLLMKVMENGKRLIPEKTTAEIRQYCVDAKKCLPDGAFDLKTPYPYPLEYSGHLQKLMI
ncbi:MAG: nicotinate phosphoribosyltransferase [Candidatus Omnitrophica bacterium]|nr:nicotinate phosphoribosyltransferase [Candidatus Omnitrophota bacterium]